MIYLNMESCKKELRLKPCPSITMPMPSSQKVLTQRLAAHYRAADAKPGAPPPPPEGQLVVTLDEPLPLQVRAP
jgi:hypothetical protein